MPSVWTARLCGHGILGLADEDARSARSCNSADKLFARGTLNPAIIASLVEALTRPNRPAGWAPLRTMPGGDGPRRKVDGDRLHTCAVDRGIIPKQYSRWVAWSANQTPLAKAVMALGNLAYEREQLAAYDRFGGHGQ